MESQTTYNYHCAQNAKRQKKPEKVSDPKKHRDKEAMDSFDCHGWLTLTVADNSDTIAVTLDHRMSHIAYCPIDLPEEVDTIIRENSGFTPSQVRLFIPLTVTSHRVISNKVWTEVLKRFPRPEFSRAAVYARWAAQDRKNWKRDDDEVKSASLLIAEAESLSSLYTVAPIELPTEDGFTAVAFALPELLRQWGGRIREIALDSTCE